jgi:hypothetical protein
MKKSTSVKIFLSFIIILILSLTGLINSNWLNTKLNIDGLSGDWENAAISFEKKLGIDYAFKNDAENLFVLFVFKDPKYLSTVSASGITIWFNTEGKKKKNYGITFTNQKVSADAYISYLERKSGPIPEEEKKKMRANRFYSFHLANVINKKSKSSSQSSESGGKKLAVFRSKSQNKMIVYEFAIPLERLTENAPGIGTEPGKTIKIGFESNWPKTSKSSVLPGK